MKTITAWELKPGMKIRFKGYEMWVETVRKNESECTVSLWGSWVFFGVGASENIVCISENWVDL